jgi:hypothetical protein
LPDDDGTCLDGKASVNPTEAAGVASVKYLPPSVPNEPYKVQCSRSKLP